MIRTISALGVALLLTLAGAGPAWSKKSKKDEVGGLFNLCKIVDCTKSFLSSKVFPKINKVIGRITPGGEVVIAGSGFGPQDKQGTVRLYHGAFGSKGYKKLKISYWSDHTNAVKIPANIVGVKDGKMMLRVIRKDGSYSNKWGANFIATRQIKMLKYKDPTVKLISCGDDANSNECIGYGGISYAGSWCGTLCGYHYNYWGTIGADSDIDEFRISGLKNGWVFEDIDIEKYASSSDDVIKGLHPKFPKGAASWNPQFVWKVTPNDFIRYRVSVYIIGPKGVPHK